MDTVDREAIMFAASAAPSGDNSQPWVLRWSGDFLDLWIDDSRSGRHSDSTYLLSDMALGACLENICVQAACQGCPAQVRLFPASQSERLWVARIAFGSGAPVNADIASAITRRHTDRSFPWAAPSDELCRRLAAWDGGGGDARLHLVPRGELRKQALRLIGQAERLRFVDRILHEELFRAVRFDVGWNRSCEEGLPPGALGIERPLRPVFKGLRSWPMMHALNFVGAPFLLGFRSAQLPASRSPLLYVLKAKSLQRRHVVAAGQVLERFWLMAESEGLAVQPLAAVGAVLYGGALLGKRAVGAREDLRIHAEALCVPGPALMFLRVGISRVRPSTQLRSGRRNVGLGAD